MAKLAASSAYFCQNADVTFTDSSVSNEGVGSSIWDFGNGAKDTALPYTTKYKFTAEGSFKVRLITVTPFGCRDTIDSTFVVRPAPLNKIDIKQISLCLKTNEFDFTDQSTISAGTYTTGWTFKNNQTATTSAMNGTLVNTILKKGQWIYGHITTASIFTSSPGHWVLRVTFMS